MNNIAFIFLSLLLHKWQYQNLSEDHSQKKGSSKRKNTGERSNAERSKDIPFLTPVSLSIRLWPSSPISLWRTPIPIPEPSSLITASMKPEAHQPPYHSGWTAVYLPVHLPGSRVHPYRGTSQSTCRHCLLMTCIPLIYLGILSDGHRVRHVAGVINICRRWKRKQEERMGER